MNPSGVSVASDKVGWLTKDGATKSKSGGGKSGAGGGGGAVESGFAGFGLDAQMIDTLTNTLNFLHPTPIQRKAIPLLMQGADIVAMARTGSGKTAAFTIPMIQRLREHSAVVGMRGVVFSPTRELALQTLRHFRQLAKHTNLRATSLTGGDTLHGQFEALAENPDVVVSSPGRLLHITEEVGQNLLARVQVCVLDEADRLFEMGFQAQIVALLKRVPERAQRCLFSATMPTILAEFTEAGLHNPVVVRLDSEMKLSSTLKHSAFVVRGDEKYGALLYILTRLVRVPCQLAMTNIATAEVLRKRLNPTAAQRNREAGTAPPVVPGGWRLPEDGGVAGGPLPAMRNRGKAAAAAAAAAAKAKKPDGKTKREERLSRQRATTSGEQQLDVEHSDDEAYELNRMEEHGNNADGSSSQASTQVLIFVESKYHVDFLGDLLPSCYGIKTVAIHGGMDQEGRRDAIHTFRRRQANVLVVTDVAARGIDLPALDYTINFSFPHEPKLFLHRVGRVARAGRPGTAYSIVTADDMPYYFDVTHFIGRTPTCRRPEHLAADQTDMAFTADDGCYGRIPTHDLQREVDTLGKLIRESVDLTNLFGVTERAHDKYTRTKKRATHDGMSAAHDDELLRYENVPIHPMLEASLSDEVRGYHAALQELRTFKAKETLLDIIHGGPIFNVRPRAASQTLSGAHMLRKLTGEILGTAAAAAAPASSGKAPVLSLADRMSLRAAERRRGRDGAGAGGDGDAPANDANDANNNGNLSMSVRSMFGSGNDAAAAQQKKSSANNKNGKGNVSAANMFSTAGGGDGDGDGGDYRDHDFFLEAEKADTIDSAHLSLRGHAMDINAEDAEGQRTQRSVFAWNKHKNRYIKMNVNEAKAMVKGMKNESGSKINFKTKLDAYRTWTKTSNMRIQDVGEMEDLQKVHQAHASRALAAEMDERNQYGKPKGGDAGGGALEEDDDYDPALLEDPKHKQKARVGRKMKKMPKGGQIKTFEQMSLEKRRKAKDAAKLEARRARKGAKKQAGGGGRRK